MKRMMRAAAAAVLVAGGTGSIGCTHTRGGNEGAAGGGGVYRSFVDPCWPERYSMQARSEVLAPFAQQVNNGHAMHQTIWNWYFDEGTANLNPAGRAKLDTLAQTRPAPDARLYLQAARDLKATNENSDKVAAAREDLTSKRAAAVLKYMGTQPAIGNAMAYEVFVHDAPTLGMPAAFAARAFRSQAQGYVGNLEGAAGGGGAGAGGTNAAGSTGN